MRNVTLITENDLCISCGACRHACPSAEISMTMNSSKGFYEPVIANTSSCVSCEPSLCLEVCPSYRVDFVHLAGWTEADRKIGPWYALYTGHSTASNIRARASSGGIIREIGRYCLEQGVVDGVITLRHVQGLDYEPSLYTEVEDVLTTPGSIYHNVNFEQAISILKSKTGRFLLIATPCQLTSVRKWQLSCPDQSLGQVTLTIGLVCGWMFSRYSVFHFAKAVGIEPANLQNVTYRGGDRVGALRLETLEQTWSFSRRPRYRTDKHTALYKIAFSRTYNNKRCLLCVDHLNYLADIVIGDAWLEAFKKDKLGTSIIIVRNSRMDAVLQELDTLGRINLKLATEADIIESQSADLAYGISAQRIVRKMKQRSQFVPVFELPHPDTGLPTFNVWYKNYLKPLVFRYLTWNGWGYGLYNLRIFWYHLTFWIRLPFLMARKRLRAILFDRRAD